MLMVSHGGHCCGIRTIWGMGETPEAMQSAFPKQFDDRKLEWLTAPPTGTNKHCFPAVDFPLETGAERLKRLLELQDAVQTYGIVEVTTAAAQTGYWKEELEAQGFKKSCECLNSNSLNVVTVWHRCRDSVENRNG
jgi:hypothetical protein